MPESPALTMAAADAALADVSAEVTEPGQASPAEAPAVPEAPPVPDAAPAKAPAEGEPAKAVPTEPSVSEAELSPDDYTGFDSFSYRAEGSQETFPGAYADADGRVLFTKQSVPVLKQALASAHALPRIQRELTARISSEAQSRKAAEATRDALLTRMMEFGQNPQAAQEFLQNLAVNIPVLVAEAKAKGLEAEREADRQRLSEYEAEKTDREQRPVLEGMIDEALDTWLVGDYAVDDGTRGALRDRFLKHVDRIFPKGENGQRQDARGSVMRDDLLWFFSGRPKSNGKAEPTRNPDGTFAKPTDKKLELAKLENAKRTEPVKAPPTVAAGKATTVTGGKSPIYKTTREADDAIWS